MGLKDNSKIEQLKDEENSKFHQHKNEINYFEKRNWILLSGIVALVTMGLFVSYPLYFSNIFSIGIIIWISLYSVIVYTLIYGYFKLLSYKNTNYIEKRLDNIVAIIIFLATFIYLETTEYSTLRTILSMLSKYKVNGIIHFIDINLKDFLSTGLLNIFWMELSILFLFLFNIIKSKNILLSIYKISYKLIIPGFIGILLIIFIDFGSQGNTIIFNILISILGGLIIIDTFKGESL